MKKKTTLVMLFILTASVLMAQNINQQMAVTTQELDRNVLKELGLSEDEIEQITEIREQFREVRERTNLERNVIKAQLAQELYGPDADEREINRMLERASELRLEQERVQVHTYLQIRRLLGEEKWSEILRKIRARQRRGRSMEAPDVRSGAGNPGRN